MYKFDIDLSFKEINTKKLAFISIALVKKKDNFLVPLLSVLIDSPSELEWFHQNKKYILSEELPIQPSYENKSIADSIDRFYDEYDDDSDDIQQLEEIYEYRTRHGLRFTFRGRDVPDIYIGKFHNEYEISLCNGELNQLYEIDIDSLFSEITKIHTYFLHCIEEGNYSI